jgi:hypothetical protein
VNVVTSRPGRHLPPWYCTQRFLAFPLFQNVAESLGRVGAVHPAGLFLWCARGPGEASLRELIAALRLSAPLLNQNSTESLGTATEAIRRALFAYSIPA